MELMDYVGKEIKVVYNDGSQVTIRKGVMKGVDNGFLFLKQEAPYPELAIALASVVRIEMNGGK
jgi:hypothetical protein